MNRVVAFVKLCFIFLLAVYFTYLFTVNNGNSVDVYLFPFLASGRYSMTIAMLMGVMFSLGVVSTVLVCLLFWIKSRISRKGDSQPQ